MPEPLHLTLSCFPVSLYSHSASLLERLASYYMPLLQNTPVLQPCGHPESMKVFLYETAGINEVWPGFIEVCRQSAGKRPKERVMELNEGRVIQKIRSGIWIHLHQGEAVFVGPLSDYLNQVVNILNDLAANTSLEQGGMVLHSGAVRWGRLGVAIAGASGSGKTTTLLEMMNEGARFVSNDRLIIPSPGEEGRIRAIGYPKLPRANPGTILFNPKLARVFRDSTLERYAGMDADTLREVEDKRDIPVHQIYGAESICPETGLDILLLLDWRWGSRERTKVHEVSALSEGEWIAMVRDTYPYRLTGDKPDAEMLLAMRKMIQRLPVYRICGAMSPSALMEWLSGKLSGVERIA